MPTRTRTQVAKEKGAAVADPAAQLAADKGLSESAPAG
jgi:hypothetical protein